MARGVGCRLGAGELMRGPSRRARVRVERGGGEMGYEVFMEVSTVAVEGGFLCTSAIGEGSYEFCRSSAVSNTINDWR